MKRALLAIFGAILIIAGVGAAGLGGTVAYLSGPDGVVSADAGRVSGDGYALLFNEFTVNTVADPATVREYAELSMGAKSRNGKDVFLGIAPASAVNNYLKTTARDVVSDVSDGTARVVPIPGRTVPAAPGDQTFWTAKAQGSDPTISLAQSGDDQTLVIMNAVPEPQVSVDITLGLASSALFPAGLGLLILGTVLLVLGIWIVVRAVKARRHDEPPSSGPDVEVSVAAPLADYRSGIDQTISLTTPKESNPAVSEVGASSSSSVASPGPRS